MNEGFIELKVLDKNQQVSKQKIELGFSNAFVIGSGCIIEFIQKDKNSLEKGKYLLQIHKGNKLYELLESSADSKQGDFLLFDIQKLKIDSNQNFEISLNSSTQKSFTKIKFASNNVSIQKRNEKSYSNILEYDQPLEIDLPIHFFNLLTSNFKHTEIKKLPSQFFNMFDFIAQKNFLSEHIADDYSIQITTSKINVGKKTLKLAKIYNTKTNETMCYVVNGNKLFNFTPENTNFYSKENSNEFMLAISLPGPKGIGNAKTTKAIAIEGLTKENIDEAWKLIGGDKPMNIQDSSKLGQLVNIKAISKERELTKKNPQIETTHAQDNLNSQNLQNEKGNNMQSDLNPTSEEYEKSLNDFNFNYYQTENNQVIPEEVLKNTPPANEMSQDELDKELGNPLSNEYLQHSSSDESNQNFPSNDLQSNVSEQTTESKLDENVQETTNDSIENKENKKTEKPKEVTKTKGEEQTYDFSIIAKLFFLALFVASILTSIGGGLLPLILGLSALTTGSLTYTFEDKLSKVKIKRKSKEEKKANKEKKKAKKLENKVTKQTKKENKKEQKAEKKDKKADNKKNKQQTKQQEVEDSSMEQKTSQVNNENSQNKKKALDLYQTKQSKINKVLSTMDSKINTCNSKLAQCKKEHSTLLEIEEVAKSKNKISKLEHEKINLEMQKNQVETKDKEMQNMLATLKNAQNEQEEQNAITQLKNITNDINSCIQNFKNSELSFTKTLNSKEKEKNSTQKELEQDK